jgi:PAS domain S-box-containing protein
MVHSLIDPANFRQILVRAVTGPLILMTLIVGVLIAEFSMLNGSVERLKQADSVISEARRTQSILADMQADHRGYLLPPHDQSFLTDYQDLADQLTGSLGKLTHMVEDNGTQVEALQNLAAAIQQSKAAAQAEQAAHATDHDFSAQARLGSSMLDDSLRTQFDQFAATEEALRNRQYSAAQSIDRATRVTVVVLAVLLALFFVSSIRVQLRALSSSYEQAMRLMEDQANAVRKSEEWLATTLRSIADAVIVTDRFGRVSFMNPIAEALTGCRLEDAVDRDLNDVYKVVHERSRSPVRSSAMQALESGGTVGLSSSSLLISEFGIETPIEDNTALIRDRFGTVIGAVLVFRDATERRRTEGVLRESEERFRTMADSAPVLIWVADARGRFSFFNSPWLDFTGRRAELERGDGWMANVHREDAGALRQAFNQALADRTGFEAEFRLRRTDGEYRWLLNRGAPRFSPDGAFLGLVGSAIDMTERKELEAQLLQSQKLEGIGRLAGGVAHDFNNLLTAIMGYAELAEARGTADTKVAEDLHAIHKAGERAAQLTRQLLAFARRQVAEPRVFNLNAQILSVESLLRRLIGEDIQLVTHLEANLGSIKADPGQIEQVIMNMAVNARDAMPDGGTITLETEEELIDRRIETDGDPIGPGAYVCLSIIDTGAGMTDEVKAHIFEPFFTTKPSDKGTGLGLATCYGIVRQAGGRITVESSPDRGSAFRMHFPRVTESVEAPITVELPEHLPRGTETILLAEDEPVVRELAARVLEEQGYTVLQAENGEHALRVAADYAGERIDLLLSDVVMPRLGGRDLAHSLLNSYPGIRVLLASGYTDDEVLRRMVRESGGAFLQKPFTPMGLTRKVREVLEAPAPVAPVAPVAPAGTEGRRDEGMEGQNPVGTGQHGTIRQ